MRNREEIHQIGAYCQSLSSTPLVIDEEAVSNTYTQQHNNQQSIIIKILVIIGGLLTCISATAFLLIVGLYESPTAMVILGLLSIILPIYFSKQTKQIFLDTLLLSTFCIGYCLLGTGLFALNIETRSVLFIFTGISLITLLFIDNYIICFISVLILIGSAKFLIDTSNLGIINHLFTSIVAVASILTLLNEAKIFGRGKHFQAIYEPVKIALLLSFIYLLAAPMVVYASYNSFDTIYSITLFGVELSSYIIVSIVVFCLLFNVLKRILNTLDIYSTKDKTIIYLFTLLILLPTSFQPSISGSLLLILTCFLVNYKTGLALSIVSFLYFVVLFYYDMNISLLTKSIALIATGILFFVIYYITSNKLATDEKE